MGLCPHIAATISAAVIVEKFSVAVDFSTHALNSTCYSLQ